MQYSVTFRVVSHVTVVLDAKNTKDAEDRAEGLLDTMCVVHAAGDVQSVEQEITDTECVDSFCCDDDYDDEDDEDDEDDDET